MKIIPSKDVVALTTEGVWTLASQGKIEVVEKNQPEIGKVIAMGKNKPPVPFGIGDVIAYRKYGEFKFWISGEEIIFVKFEDILAILK